MDISVPDHYLNHFQESTGDRTITLVLATQAFSRVPSGGTRHLVDLVIVSQKLAV
jgi:hypothetical protein